MYTLIRSSRKTIALKVLKDGTLQVKAPKQVSQSEIERFIEEKSESENSSINSKAFFN